MDRVINILQQKKIELNKDIEWSENDTKDILFKKMIPEHKKTILEIDKAINLLSK